MNKKRVLFLLHLPPPVHGSSVVGKSIKESLLINSQFDCAHINLLASQNVAESGKINLRKLKGFFKVCLFLLSNLVKQKPALCYLALTATGAAFYKDVILVILLRLFKMKRIYHLHNKGFEQHRDKLVNRWLYRFVFQNADVILLSRFLYQDIQEFVSGSKIHICPNGIPDIADQQSKDNNRIVQILFLSNLIESKGALVLLDACKKLKGEGLSFYCSFVGSEGDITRERFEEEVKQRKLEEHVSYLGRKLDKEKELIFAQADIFAFPTFYCNETFGLVNLEAMQHALPIVSTFEGGIPDVVEDGVTGFLIQQKDTEALSEKLSILIRDKELRERMGKAGRKRYEQNFTLEIFEKRLLSILESIV